MKKSDFQFQNPRLINLTFSERKIDTVDSKEHRIQNKFHVGVIKNDEEHAARVELSVVIGDLEEAPFMITATMAADFQWSESTTVLIDSMLQINAPALLLSYLRPIIANITNASRYPMYSIPFINFKDGESTLSNP